MANLTVATVNVNGLRAAVGKDAKNGSGMVEWFKSQVEKGLDVLCLQETKISKNKKEELIGIYDELGINACDFHLQEDINDSGHGGVAVWINPKTCQTVHIEYPFEKTDEAIASGFSGRWQEIVIKFANQEIAIVNSYYHRAKSPTHKEKGVLISRENSEKSMNAKHCFFDKTTLRMRKLISKYGNFILVGDINTAHHYRVDIKNFKDNKKSAGFLPEERAWLDLWFAKQGEINVQSTYVEGKSAADAYKENLDIKYTPPPTGEFTKGGLGLRDVIRERYGKDKKIYSWWSRRPTPKGYPFDNNVGWRLDYQIASESMAESVKEFEIQKYVSREKCWSDHAPVVVTYNL